jgi:hypothetical protein
MDDYLSKPLRAHDLLETLERWGEKALGRRPGVERAARPSTGS